jgi:hypothetical protein
MGHDAALEAHEHTEHAEHAAHAGDAFVSRIAITVAVLAVFAAVAGSLETFEEGRALSSANEAVLKQDEATDTWNEFQADSLKKHIYGIAANAHDSFADDYKKNAKEYTDTQKKLMKDAREKEAERDELIVAGGKHEDRQHWLTGAATLFEIGIAMSTVAIITRRHWLYYSATAFGVVGLVLLALAYIL